MHCFEVEAIDPAVLIDPCIEKLNKEKGYGDEGLWTGGGYEGTHFWIDPKRDFVGLIMTQMFETPKAGHGRDNEIRGEVYKQIFKQED